MIHTAIFSPYKRNDDHSMTCVICGDPVDPTGYGEIQEGHPIFQCLDRMRERVEALEARCGITARSET